MRTLIKLAILVGAIAFITTMIARGMRSLQEQVTQPCDECSSLHKSKLMGKHKDLDI